MGDADDRLLAQIRRKAARRQRARRPSGRSPWLDLGLYGVVGWSIVLPTLAGVALGLWIDTVRPSRFSWTLMLLAAGLFIGCWNAWRWVTLEQQAIHDDDGEEHEMTDQAERHG